MASIQAQQNFCLCATRRSNCTNFAADFGQTGIEKLQLSQTLDCGYKVFTNISVALVISANSINLRLFIVLAV